MTCPCCTSDHQTPHLKVKDHFLSQEDFSLLQCNECGLLSTSPVPSADKLGDYYKSEEYLSHGADKRGLFASLYRLAKGYNLGSKIGVYRSQGQGLNLLDYGCGTGDLIARAQVSGFIVRGAEPSQEAVSHSPDSVKTLIVSPEEELESNRTYDLISLWHVLEHIPNPTEVISKLKTKLNLGGRIVIAVPNHQSYDAKHYGKYWAAWDVPRHLWHFSPNQMIQFMNGLGLQHVDSQPMWLDAYYVALLSERYKNGSALSGLFYAGLSNLRALFQKKRHCSSQVYIFRLK